MWIEIKIDIQKDYPNIKYVLVVHNDPLHLKGSKTSEERKAQTKEEVAAIEDKLEITKSIIAEESKTQIQLPAEPDDDDDDIEKIKSNILKTLSKIEQAEVD